MSSEKAGYTAGVRKEARMTTAPESPARRDTRVAVEATGLEELLGELAASQLDSAPAEQVRQSIASMVEHVEYPCLGAKSVIRRDRVTHLVLDDLTAESVSEHILVGLRAFADLVEQEDGFHSFVVTFRGPLDLDERTFEHLLWTLLQRIHDDDDQPWAPEVSADPRNPHFAFSAAGNAYFLVGLHPAASRIARRAPLPTIVFNPHAQFQQLRESGRFEGMRAAIRRRDRDLQGSVNPMAADHGEASEALQYSGRARPLDWEPPLVVHEPTEGHS
jgi:FPC/CPF motif-containing protein YcgG